MTKRNRWTVYLLAALVFGTLAVIFCIVCNIASIKVLSDAGSAKRNMITKLCHIPFHIVMLMLIIGMVKIYLFLGLWIPFVLSFSVITYTGFANIGACISLFRNKKCSLPKALIIAILGFIEIGELVGAGIQKKTAGTDQ